MAVTPIFGWTIAEATTLLRDFPAVMAAGIKDIEDSLHIDGTSLVSATAYTSYPVGMSVAEIASAPDGGWPQASGLVFTIRSKVGSRTAQFFLSGATTGPPLLWTRVGGSTGWASWVQFVGPTVADAVASGTFTFNNAAAPASATVAFPVGRFTSTPTVTVSTHDRDVVAGVAGKSSTGFTVLLGANGGGPSFPVADYQVDWIAMQSS